MEVAILGGGMAGLSAAYTLADSNIEHAVYEKNDQYGGLCKSFHINDYTFDTFAHVAFSKDDYVNQMLENKTAYLKHKPEAMNYYHGTWIRNPAQNNLVDLDIEERIKVIKGFIERNEMTITNYGDWLKAQYGDYFSEHFPACYTRKYWTVEPEKLETEWVKGRMYTPDLEEILRGAMMKETPNVHYTKEIHYPKKGGFGAFLKPFTEKSDIYLNKEVVKVDSKQKKIIFSDGESVLYQKLISTMPLDALIACMDEAPNKVINAANNLDYTSGVIISIGLKRKNVAPALWFYIYDEDILPARVYAPNIKSPNNIPKDCCALQAEIYFSKYRPRNISLEEIKCATVVQLMNIGLFKEEDIEFADAREEKYANIIFTPHIYQNRKIVHDYLDSLGIIYAGRFGEWDYLWTDQSILSGKAAAEKIVLS